MKNKTIRCEKGLTIEECELAILRSSIDLAETKLAKRIVNSPEIQEIIIIVENFIKQKGFICYGGQAINQELPEEDRFYDREVDIPDYDFFSYNALDDAKELGDIYVSKGYKEVECKSGQHHGTYKVFVNFIPIADISFIPKDLFMTLKKDSIRVSGILYAPSEFLKMGMYMELSRPAGDLTRWEKVAKRLALLNKHYPLPHEGCDTIYFQRNIENKYKDRENEIYEMVKNTLINQGVVFFGGFGLSFYAKYMPKKQQENVKKIADFDVLIHEPQVTAEIVRERLADIDIHVKIVKRKSIGEIVPEQYEISLDGEPIVVLYEPTACYSFNTIKVNHQKIKIATIDTMLFFYLAFLYANKPYYDVNRILCMANFLYHVQQRNKLAQKGVLRRFTITCYGHQDSVEEMRAQKAEKFKELKDKRGTREYEEWFLNYRPGDKKVEETKPDNEFLSKKEHLYTRKEREVSFKKGKTMRKRASQKKRKNRFLFF